MALRQFQLFAPQASAASQPVQPIPASIPIDEQGNTPLHRAILACDVQAANQLIASHPDLAARMSRMVNHDGRLPYDYVGRLKYGVDGFEELRQHLFSMMVSQSYLMKMADKLDLTAIQQRYRQPASLDFQATLTLAVEAANYARSIILQSATHPEFNACTPDELRSMSTKLSELSSGSPFFPSRALLSDEKILEITKRNQVGNCYEYALLVREYVKQHGYQGRIEMVAMANGDHVFIVLGRNPGGDINNYKEWGRDCIVCDAWRGSVYSASELENYLGDCRKILREPIPTPPARMIYHVITSFNPHYHKLEVRQAQLSAQPAPFAPKPRT